VGTGFPSDHAGQLKTLERAEAALFPPKAIPLQAQSLTTKRIHSEIIASIGTSRGIGAAMAAASSGHGPIGERSPFSVDAAPLLGNNKN